MLGDMIIADAVVHGYNWTPENFAIPASAVGANGTAAFHRFMSGDDPSQLQAHEFLRNWGVDELEEALFLESPLDIVAHHGTPLWDMYKDGLADTEKGFELRRRNPDRVLVYAAVNPFHGEKALREIEEYAERGANAIKVYAARYQDGRTYAQPLDDPEFGFPFIQKVLDCGIRIIGTHKVIPIGPVKSGPFGMFDIPTVCTTFPEMQFEVVHAGFAFVEETAFLSSLSNCWLNLEASASLIFRAPRRFAEFFGAFLQRGFTDRIMFGSGCTFTHPAPSIQAILDFEMPEDLVEGYGYPAMTDAIKRGVLGGNFLRLHGIDEAELRLKIADDDWSRRRAEHGIAEPWSHVRERDSRVPTAAALT